MESASHLLEADDIGRAGIGRIYYSDTQRMFYYFFSEVFHIPGIGYAVFHIGSTIEAARIGAQFYRRS
jgi:ABC-type anion transport system duplicated permease subunit